MDRDLLVRYADDLAYVADRRKATTLDALTNHIDLAADNFDAAQIPGTEDLAHAKMLITEAISSDTNDRDALLRRADKLLNGVGDMTGEYRLAAGD